jgi:hypothetical protein
LGKIRNGIKLREEAFKISPTSPQVTQLEVNKDYRLKDSIMPDKVVGFTHFEQRLRYSFKRS